MGEILAHALIEQELGASLFDATSFVGSPSSNCEGGDGCRFAPLKMRPNKGLVHQTINRDRRHNISVAPAVRAGVHSFKFRQ